MFFYQFSGCNTGLKIEGEGECFFAPEAVCTQHVSTIVQSSCHHEPKGLALGSAHCSVPSCAVPGLLLSGTHSTGSCPAKSSHIIHKPGSCTSVPPP